MQLPGVGRKTANVVLSEAFGVPTIAVDTHVERVTKRMGIVPPDASVRETEEILMARIPKNDGVMHIINLFILAVNIVQHEIRNVSQIPKLISVNVVICRSIVQDKCKHFVFSLLIT